MFFLSIIYVSGAEREISSKLLGAASVGFGYVTGILAVLFNAVLLFVGFVLSLPVVSNMYSFISMLLSKIFGVLVKNTLRSFEWYRNLELRVKNSEAYLRARAAKKKSQAMENSARIAAAGPNSLCEARSKTHAPAALCTT